MLRWLATAFTAVTIAGCCCAGCGHRAEIIQRGVEDVEQHADRIEQAVRAAEPRGAAKAVNEDAP